MILGERLPGIIAIARSLTVASGNTPFLLTDSDAGALQIVDLVILSSQQA